MTGPEEIVIGIAFEPGNDPGSKAFVFQFYQHSSNYQKCCCNFAAYLP